MGQQTQTTQDIARSSPRRGGDRRRSGPVGGLDHARARTLARVGMIGVGIAGAAVAGAVLLPVSAPDDFVLATPIPLNAAPADQAEQAPEIEVDIEQLQETLRIIAGQKEPEPVVQAEPDTPKQASSEPKPGGTAIKWRYLGSIVHPGGRSALIHTGRQQMILNQGTVRKDDATRWDVELLSVDDEKIVIAYNNREQEIERAERNGFVVGIAAKPPPSTNQNSPQLTPAQNELNEALGVDPVKARELARERIDRARRRQEQLRERREAAERLRDEEGQN